MRFSAQAERTLQESLAVASSDKAHPNEKYWVMLNMAYLQNAQG
jgi:hypothetical protein